MFSLSTISEAYLIGIGLGFSKARELRLNVAPPSVEESLFTNKSAMGPVKSTIFLPSKKESVSLARCSRVDRSSAFSNL